jgi:hypothetical protein
VEWLFKQIGFDLLHGDYVRWIPLVAREPMIQLRARVCSQRQIVRIQVSIASRAARFSPLWKGPQRGYASRSSVKPFFLDHSWPGAVTQSN